MADGLITTLLVEDHEITRIGLRKMLDEMVEITVVGEAGDGKAAVTKALELCPQLVLMDIGLPGMDGIEATKLIKRSMPTKVIMLTSHENAEDIFAGLSAGADAYCLKWASSSQIASAIHSVIDGALWLDPGIAKRVIEAAVGSQDSTSPLETDTFGLSERESEVLALLVEGLSNKQMAERLSLGSETIKTHMHHIMEKLSVSDRTQAAVKAVKHRLLPEAKN